MHFFTFTHVPHAWFAYKFFWSIFYTILNFSQKIFFGHISACAKNGSTNPKMFFCKCILDLFASIKGFVFFIF
jgi:hypothetical protein